MKCNHAFSSSLASRKQGSFRIVLLLPPVVWRSWALVLQGSPKPTHNKVPSPDHETRHNKFDLDVMASGTVCKLRWWMWRQRAAIHSCVL
eukprot:4512492-Amphidinium_carterae.1